MNLLLPATATLFSCLLLFTLHRLRKNGRRPENGLKLPELAGAWPIVGHLPLLLGQAPAYRTLAAMADEVGPVFALRLGLRRAVVVSSREAVMECFTTNDGAFLSRPSSAAHKYMGYNGAIFALAHQGAFWRDLRRISTQELLSRRRLEAQRPVRVDEIEACMRDLYSLCVENGEKKMTRVNMSQWFRLVTMNMMLRVTVGTRYSESDVEGRLFARAMDDFMHFAGVFEVSDVIPGIEWLDLQGNVRSMKRIGEEMDRFMSQWMETQVKSKRNGVVKEEQDFMDVMLSLFPEGNMAYGHKTENLVKGTVISLIMGGTDTTTAALTWAISLLLNHPKSLQIVQAELDTNVGTERKVQESDLKNLPYLQSVVKETLRLYPSGPLSIPREAMEDCRIGGFHVSKGTRLIVNLWKLHRDPRAWSDADEFRPDRFLGEVPGERQFEYLPFSSGRRGCPGSMAALRIMQLVLARLVQGFSLAAPVEGEAVDMREGLGLTLPRARPLEVLIRPRLPCELYL